MVHTTTTLYIANLGDCRAVLGRKVGGGRQTVDLTRDHRPKLEQNRGSKRLRDEELFWDDEGWCLSGVGQGGEIQRLGVSRALGDFDMTGELSACYVFAHLDEC